MEFNKTFCIKKTQGQGKKTSPQGQGFQTLPSLWGHFVPIMYSKPIIELLIYLFYLFF